jgi:hypothetical protein
LHVKAGRVVTFAGDGTAANKGGIGKSAQFDNPSDIAIVNDSLIVAGNPENGRLSRVWMHDGKRRQPVASAK